VADQLSLPDVRSEALPGDKLKRVEEVRNKGHTVAMVGDGVNDAPALAAGHVSVAMGAAGSDVAVHNASIALMNNHLDRLPFLVRLSRRTLNVIRQNLAFTLAYILIMVALLAIAASDPVWAARMPIIAAIGHGLSSIIVVFNSARLVREGEEVESEGIQAMPWEIPTETKKTVAPSGAPAPATA